MILFSFQYFSSNYSLMTLEIRVSWLFSENNKANYRHSHLWESSTFCDYVIEWLLDAQQSNQENVGVKQK